MEKNKKLIVLGVIALILIVSGITYAILTWTSSKINIGLTSNCFTIDYTKGNDIANASIKALNESDLISNNKFTIKEGIALTYANIGIKSTCTIEGYGSLYLTLMGRRESDEIKRLLVLCQQLCGNLDSRQCNRGKRPSQVAHDFSLVASAVDIAAGSVVAGKDTGPAPARRWRQSPGCSG